MTFGAGISNYLRWSTATQVITSFNWQMDQLLLGKLISRVELGQFSMASNLSFMPSQIIVNQVTGPLVVAFAVVRDDAERMRAAYRKSAITIVSVALPISIGMSMLSAPMEGRFRSAVAGRSSNIGVVIRRDGPVIVCRAIASSGHFAP